MMDKWLSYPEYVPTESGYYNTYYFNPKQNEWFYKPLFYSFENKMFTGPWSWSYSLESLKLLDGTPAIDKSGNEIKIFVFHPINVAKYDAISRTDYYSQQWESTT